jgi:hypothetical protein
MTDTSSDVAAEAPECPATDVLRVSVRCIDNTTLDLRVPPASSVRQLKTAFAEASGSEQSGELRVFFNGRVLGDGEALEEVGVRDGCCVHVTPGRGGAAPPVEEPSEVVDPAAELVALQAVQARLELLAERARREERSGRRRLVDNVDGSPLGDNNADFWLGIVLGACCSRPTASHLD